MPRKHADRIADALEERVFTGTYPEGERLDEVSLAREFSVSRTPIREALQRLVAAHLAEQLPRRGVFVRQPSPDLVSNMFETMAELEAACGRLATGRIDATALSRLEAANDGCLAAIDARDAPRYAQANEAFHKIIYSASGNDFLAEETTRLYRRLKPFRRVQLQLRGRMAESIREHGRIITALAARDGLATAEALRRHVGPQGARFYPDIAELAVAG